MTKRPNLSRRRFLRGSALLAGAAGLVGAAREAEAKVKQSIVAYQNTPNGDKRCDNCKLFEPPNACKSVEGPISPSGWCKIWIKA